MKNICLFTDGASKLHKCASSGAIIYIEGKKILELGCYHDKGTNSLGEVYAVLMGLERLKDIIKNNKDLEDSEIILISDSEYVVKSLNSYIFSWVKQGLDKEWTNSKNNPVAWQNLFKIIWKDFMNTDTGRYEIENIPISIYHINSHVDNRKIKKAKKKFEKSNSVTIDMKSFQSLIECNSDVDDLAVLIKKNKNYYYEKRYDAKWVREERKEMLRNGKRVIRRRSRS